MQKKELKEMIYFITKGLQDWKKNNWREVPNSLYRGQQLFIKHAVHSGKVPNNLFDFIKLLHQPMETWGIPSLSAILPDDAPFLVEDFGMSIDIEDFLEEYDSPEEFDQSAMKEILRYCRSSNLDEEYRQVRSFVSTPKNAVLTYVQLRTKMFSIKDSELQRLLDKCYEQVPHPIGNYRKCPHCGWTVSFVKGKWMCNKEQICKRFRSFEHLEVYNFAEDEVVYRIRPGIQRYVLLPGMMEEILYKSLKSYDPILYPNIDEFDIRIHVNGKVINLDMKDYRSPKMLANTFNNKPLRELEKYCENAFIIIPNYRLQIDATYKDLICAALNKEVKKFVRVMTERELLKRLKEGNLCQ
ncbi:hypothetical protein [Bacillus manliponensis]|uniref:restriction endonuclease-related protein n=1 Tax=Bacillus manliponensis TaxID=574376 RepID=UPI003518EE07